MAKLPALPVGDVGAFLKGVGMTLVSTVGGASGPLYGTFFLQLGGGTAARADIELGDFATAMEAGIAGIQRLGKAEPGDKTMLDALLPARDALRGGLDRGDAPADALAAAVAAAEQGMLATIPLVARKGRASYLGERSAGHQDPGATSSHLLLKAAADTWFQA
jgi:dihydroxyacetone kinase-like protein